MTAAESALINLRLLRALEAKAEGHEDMPTWDQVALDEGLTHDVIATRLTRLRRAIRSSSIAEVRNKLKMVIERPNAWAESATNRYDRLK